MTSTLTSEGLVVLVCDLAVGFQLAVAAHLLLDLPFPNTAPRAVVVGCGIVIVAFALRISRLAAALDAERTRP